MGIGLRPFAMAAVWSSAFMGTQKSAEGNPAGTLGGTDGCSEHGFFGDLWGEVGGVR